MNIINRLGRFQGNMIDGKSWGRVQIYETIQANEDI